MAFNRHEVDRLLADCHRRCCICHRFCGVKIETDHITPVYEGGEDDIDNAIAVCFECHAEIHSYNDQHPRGRKFTAEELRLHKDSWLALCREQPHLLLAPSRSADVGPLQALIDELAFNAKLALRSDYGSRGGLFHDQQLRRAIEQGSIAILKDDIRNAVLDAYGDIEAANGVIRASWSQGWSGNLWTECMIEASRRIEALTPKIEAAADALLKFLHSEEATVT